ncbi:SWIM zinc finger family protein [Rariglobus hedericola]|uniref:SWIM zinc finger family protein n=1 Tax=Rariglobus hedericola TaxID=2597822 RepID=UPI001396A57C|nr:SWIM zinc finger family protein [Rariglobus hedericola]
MAALPTPDQITALAPDAASLKAGRDLAAPRKWTLLGADADALWGLAQGSGKEPYQTRVALDGLSTKCSCPSRKFPCKHALGLLFIAATTPAALTDKNRPAWLVEWLEGRAERQEKSKERAEQKATGAATPVDEAAKAKRQEKRAGRVDDGVALLSQWLADLARRGLADSGLNAHAAWDDIIRRMVDAQATGLARRLRYAAETARGGAGWEAGLAEHLGRLHLLLVAYAKREACDEDLRIELEQQVGWTLPQEQVLAGTPVQDTWFVAARTVREEDRLVVSNTWLRGSTSGRWAQLVRTSPLVQPAVDTWPPGRSLTGELCFYPGVEPLRALWRSDPQANPAQKESPGEESIEGLLVRYASGLALNPWRTRVPVLISARLGVLRGGGAALLDACGDALPLSADEDTRDLLLAITGGHAASMSVLWDGEALDPLAVADGDEWVPLTRQNLER